MIAAEFTAWLGASCLLYPTSVLQVDTVDIAARFKQWMISGFKELGDTGGMGIGATTVKVLHNSQFTSDPQRVSLNAYL